MSGFNLTITLHDAVRGLDNIVKRFGPDKRAGDAQTANDVGDAATCIYSVADEFGALVPVCIVGQFFADLGILRALLDPKVEVYSKTFTNPQACNHGGFNTEVTDALYLHYGITVTEDARTFLSEAQNAQDGGATWAGALETASEYVVSRRLVEVEPTNYTESILHAFGDN